MRVKQAVAISVNINISILITTSGIAEFDYPPVTRTVNAAICMPVT